MRGFIGVLAIALVGCTTSPGTLNPSSLSAQANTAYYVDCSTASNGSGSQSSPYNNLGSVNAITFGAGDVIYFKRGSTCLGMLWPKGSGTNGNLAKLSAYGSGTRPVINGGSNVAALKLYNQQFWRVEQLELKGGNPYGIYVAGNVNGTLDTIQIVDVIVHDVGGTATQKETGLVVVTPESANTAFQNVLIDGVTAYNTQQWAGIIVGTDNYEGQGYSGSVASQDIVIRNSVVHNVYGDGIVVFHGKNALIEKNLAHDVGLIPNTGVGTPNGIWTWWCDTCTVQYNEVYRVASPGIDGGAFDIDYWNVNNTVQYNYAHDNQGYCVAVFGAGGRATTGSVVRYNICANNGRLAGAGSGGTKLGSQQGDMYLLSWGGGSIDGVQIYGNTFYWSPASNEPGVMNKGANLSGSLPRFFRNNIMVSTVDKLVWSDPGLSLDNNLYWYIGGSSPWWGYNNTWQNSFAAYKSSSGQDTNSLYADPLLNSPTYHGIGLPTTQFTLQSGSPAVDKGANLSGMGNRDFFGNTLPKGNAHDIGAHESGLAAGGSNLVSNPGFESGLSEWSQWWYTGVNPESAAYGSTQGGHSGTGHLTHWSASSAYQQYTYQTLNGLTPGSYTLKVWTQTGGGLTKISFGGKHCNGLGTQELNLPTAVNLSWTQYSTSVTVSGGTCELFVWSESAGEAQRYANFDDLEFSRN